MKPEVSVLIPAYNVEPYIRECLDSVLAQTLQNFEIICIDDASADRTLAILREYESSDERIHVYCHEKNQGQSCGRNHALEKASGEYVYMLDADDRIVPEMLEELTLRCRRDDLDVVGFETRQFADGEEFRRNAAIRTIEYRNCPVMNGREALIYCMEEEVFSLSVPTFFMRRDYLIENGLRFTEGILHEDVGYLLELMVRAGRMTFLHKIYFLRRIRAGSTMTAGFTDKNIEGYLKSFYRSFELEPELQETFRQEPAFAGAFRKWQRDIFGRIQQLYRSSAEQIAPMPGGHVEEEIRRSFEILKITEQAGVPWDRHLEAQLGEGVYLCGTGQYTSRMIGVLGRRDLVIRGVITLRKERKAFQGFPVLGPEDLSSLDPSVPVLLSISRYYYDDYVTLLKEYGLTNRIDLRF